MQDRSAAFDAAVKASHEVVSQAVVKDPSGNPLVTLTCAEGQVTADVANAIRRQLSVTLIDPDGSLTPASATSVLSPVGNEVWVSRGVRIYGTPDPYSADVLNLSPIGYWRLGDAGPFKDATGGGNDATASGAVLTGQPGGLAGDRDGAVGFTGDGAAYVKIPAAQLGPELAGALSFSVEGLTFLEKLPASGTSPQFIADHYGPTGDPNVQFAVGFLGTPNPIFGFFDGAWHVANSPTPFPVGRWVHWAGTFDHGTLKIYIDGVLMATSTTASPVPASDGTEWRIGRRWDLTENIDGRVDEVAVYKSALDADTIRRHADIAAGKTTKYTDELIPLGVFGISTVEIDDSGDDMQIKIDGYDRSRKIQRARFADVYAVAEGTNYAQAIRDLINSRLPGLTLAFTTTDATTPALTFDAGSDPWDAVQQMAKSIGCECFFDVQGICVLQPVPGPETSPVVADYSEGETATITELTRTLSDEEAYNHAVVTGEADSEDNPPVRAEAIDSDPNSPTYIGAGYGTDQWVPGPYGDVPVFESSQYVTTADQAQDAANALLARSKGIVEQVTFEALVNPAHDVNDVVTISRKRAGVANKYVFDAVVYPLGASDPMQVTTRKTQG